MTTRRFITRSLTAMALLLHSALLAADGSIAGHVTDPQGNPVPGADLRLSGGAGAAQPVATSGADGQFVLRALSPGIYVLGAIAGDFEPATQTFRLAEGESLTVDVKFARMAPRRDAVTVTAEASGIDLRHPDPAQRVAVHHDLLDANPGHPGAPVSIPALGQNTRPARIIQ
jgi:hypothetical protein